MVGSDHDFDYSMGCWKPLRSPIASIVARIEERLAARLVDRIRPLLAGRSPEVQRFVLAELAAELIAGRQPGRCAARSRRQ